MIDVWHHVPPTFVICAGPPFSKWRAQCSLFLVGQDLVVRLEIIESDLGMSFVVGLQRVLNGAFALGQERFCLISCSLGKVAFVSFSSCT